MKLENRTNDMTQRTAKAKERNLQTPFRWSLTTQKGASLARLPRFAEIATILFAWRGDSPAPGRGQKTVGR